MENGIWLCQHCARLIDADEGRYSAATLQGWKEHAERAAALALRRQSKSEDDLDAFCRLSSKMPGLIEEMASDLHRNAEQLIREFVVLPQRGVVFNHGRPRFEYYESDHPNAQNAVHLLMEHRFVTERRPSNWPIYRMTEQFTDLVLALHPAPLYESGR